MSLWSRFVDAVSDFLGFSDKPEAPDPVADIVADVVDSDIGDTDSESESLPNYADLDYDSFAEFADDNSIDSVTVFIDADGVDVVYYSDEEGVIEEHFDQISEFFEDRYDELVAEGIEIDVEDEYARV